MIRNTQVFQRRLFRSRCCFSSAANSKIGFLGLGNMGLPMAMNLKSKFDTVNAFDLNGQAMDKAKEGGLTTVPSIEVLAQENSTIITMLPGDDAVNSAMKQVVNNCPENTTVIDCSTVSPTTSRYWHDELKSMGHSFYDAPVSGGVKGAKNASLTFMVGGSDVSIMNDKVFPILQNMGQRVVNCGGPGAGAVVKLCNNLALAAQMVGICEAMNLGETLGVDPKILADCMNTSTAKSWSCEINNPHPAVASILGSPASNDYEGGFGTKLMLKDLTLAVSAGKDAHVALPVGNATKELYQLADLRGMGSKDFGIILQFLRGK